jgi:carbon monoxide dehydrogenase subunit G
VTTHVERSIEVQVPVRTAYDQWTQFEEFPRFMSGVQEVRQVGDALTHWVAEIGGVRREWDAAILEQVPDEKVAWAATTGATNAGAVYFTAVGAGTTLVRLTLDYEPEGVVERIADVLDLVERKAVADLDRFKEYIESRGEATGGWRGSVDEGDVHPGAAAAGSQTATTDVPGDVLEVGPTGDVRTSLETERGPAHAAAATGPDDPSAVVPGHTGDPIAIDEQRSTLRTDSAADDPAEATRGGKEPELVGADDSGRGFLRGYPGEGREPDVEPDAPGTDDSGRGFLRGYPGEDPTADYGETESPADVGAGPGERRDEEPLVDDREPTVGVGPGEREDDDRVSDGRDVTTGMGGAPRTAGAGTGDPDDQRRRPPV